MEFWNENRRILALVLIVIGSIIIIYTMDDTIKNMYFLVAGIIILMFGLYTIASGISPKKLEDQSFIQTEKEEEES